MKTKLLLILLAFTSVAGAQQQGETPARDWFQQLDSNRDGRISRQEAGEKKFFSRADANGNGFVTRREAALFTRQQVGRTAETDLDEPVFPANPPAVAEKQRLLQQIETVTGRSKRPPNVECRRCETS